MANPKPPARGRRHANRSYNCSRSKPPNEIRRPAHNLPSQRQARLDNVVELFAALGGLNLPFLDALPFFNGGNSGSGSSGSGGSSSGGVRRAAPVGEPAPGVRLTLGHSFEVQGRGTVRIVYEDT